MDTKFELTFIEAMKAVLSGKFVQGEHFVWNVYLAEKDGIVMINSFHGDDMISIESIPIIQAVSLATILH